MTQLHQIYKCNKCGNIVQILHNGNGSLVCCGEEMELQKEKVTDEGKEKHVPILESLPSILLWRRNGASKRKSDR